MSRSIAGCRWFWCYSGRTKRTVCSALGPLCWLTLFRFLLSAVTGSDMFVWTEMYLRMRDERLDVIDTAWCRLLLLLLWMIFAPVLKVWAVWNHKWYPYFWKSILFFCSTTDSCSAQIDLTFGASSKNSVPALPKWEAVEPLHVHYTCNTHTHTPPPPLGPFSPPFSSHALAFHPLSLNTRSHPLK